MTYSRTLVTTQLEHAMLMANAIRGHLGRKWHAEATMRHLRCCQDLENLAWYLPHISFCIDMDAKMARQNADFSLIDYRLSDDELVAFDTWLAKQAADPTAILTELAAKSYKVSITFVESSDAWCVTITGKEDAKFNSKCSLTSWADEPLEALYMGAFKVLSIFDGGKWKTKQQSRRG